MECQIVDPALRLPLTETEDRADLRCALAETLENWIKASRLPDDIRDDMAADLLLLHRLWGSHGHQFDS
jgi:hypothetical protein